MVPYQALPLWVKVDLGVMVVKGYIFPKTSPVNFPSASSPLPSSGIELTLLGYVTGFNQHLYPLYLRTSVSEFLGIINLMSSATIFLPVHIL